MPAFSVSVPDWQREPISQLLELSKDDAARLTSDIEESDGSTSAILDMLGKGGFSGRVTFRALISLLLLQRQSRVAVRDLVDALRESIAEGSDDGETEQVGSEAASAAGGLAGDGLVVLLDNPTLRGHAKALGLRNEYERILTGSRLITDIRPIFDDVDGSAAIRAVVVNHSMRLRYVGNDRETRDLHLALDTSDLQKLKEQVDRALLKDRATQEFMETKGVIVLEPAGDEDEDGN